MTKTVLCYGDSLTWGYDPVSLRRHAYEDRWPSVLQAALGGAAHVIPEGMNGRTTAFDDHLADCDRNGARVLPTILQTHAPLDLVIIMLGTNDMKSVVAGSAFAACQGIGRLVRLIRNHAWPFEFDGPDILIIAPPAICATGNVPFAASFPGGIEESAKLATLYRDLADELGCGFFDGNSVAKTTPVDGIHLDAENTRALGRGLESTVRMMLGL
ncbi:SGNH/GDSL hydrolase family protein [Rhizobium mongolense]|uniref:Lysophospholipase L1-like esterase n=2 Tax=Rhizobium mongolense TaxID=57676 RepID=A0ABR6IUM7_9HYPH|nr:SGNH/GDSL hydrolase family protein [Rhizobium mongolense]MBB4231463.1 lysophospholipase L1-like esterase [Rhizobium mongolense]TVZ64053.1 lysophospholipase L1-like esterase [Rhizobium mongolense USDA 1844]